MSQNIAAICSKAGPRVPKNEKSRYQRALTHAKAPSCHPIYYGHPGLRSRLLFIFLLLMHADEIYN